MTSTETPMRDTAQCPLCRQSNDCRLGMTAADQGSCWCETARIPDALLMRIPTEFRHRACLCRACVDAFQREPSGTPARPGGSGDFYFDTDGRMVFTAAYHLRRGCCCNHDCRHCPYERAKMDR